MLIHPTDLASRDSELSRPMASDVQMIPLARPVWRSDSEKHERESHYQLLIQSNLRLKDGPQSISALHTTDR